MAWYNPWVDLQDSINQVLYLVSENNRMLKALTPRRVDQDKLNKIFDAVTAGSAKIDKALTPAENLKRMTAMVDHTIDETVAAVTAASGRVDSIISFAAGLKMQLAEALANVTIQPDVQAKINSIFDLSSADASKVDTALNANPAAAKR